jgi:hypothetical protein
VRTKRCESQQIVASSDARALIRSRWQHPSQSPGSSPRREI